MLDNKVKALLMVIAYVCGRRADELVEVNEGPTLKQMSEKNLEYRYKELKGRTTPT